MQLAGRLGHWAGALGRLMLFATLQWQNHQQCSLQRRPRSSPASKANGRMVWGTLGVDEQQEGRQEPPVQIEQGAHVFS